MIGWTSFDGYLHEVRMQRDCRGLAAASQARALALHGRKRSHAKRSKVQGQFQAAARPGLSTSGVFILSSREPVAKQPEGMTWRETLRVFAKRRMISMLFLGFSAGLPILLVLSTLSFWLRTLGIARATISM